MILFWSLIFLIKTGRKYNSLIKSIVDGEIIDDVIQLTLWGPLILVSFFFFQITYMLALKVPCLFPFYLTILYSLDEKSLNFWNNLFNFDAEEQDWQWEAI